MNRDAEVEHLRDALDHILRVAKASRTDSRRDRWIGILGTVTKISGILGTVTKNFRVPGTVYRSLPSSLSATACE